MNPGEEILNAHTKINEVFGSLIHNDRTFITAFSALSLVHDRAMRTIKEEMPNFDWDKFNQLIENFNKGESECQS